MLFNKFFNRFLTNKNENFIKKVSKTVNNINLLEESMHFLKDDEFVYKTKILKDDFKKNNDINKLLPEAFALVREAARRMLNMRHFDVQLIGGITLFFNKIAEMQTGEGKTLVATLPAYLNAIMGRNVHIVTVNEYLAERDSLWMKRIYEFLGLTVSVIKSTMNVYEKKMSYSSDVVYGTNNEFAFDYLRDNMIFSSMDRVQGKLYYAIVDEVDSILIDEARTPLIISGPSYTNTNLYLKINEITFIISKNNSYFNLDKKSRQVFLTELGHKEVEKLLVDFDLLKNEDSLYESSNINFLYYIYASLKAHILFKKNIDYIVKDDQIMIVDEHTGRIMDGRRWSDGIHQAVEAKESVFIKGENYTLASITFQNYFRLYDKLSGMTGTASTESQEFQQIYGLDVISIPPNKFNSRVDYPDLVYLTVKEKFEAIIKDVKKCIKNKQPVLLGTVSIETSEYLSNLFKKNFISHKVLNAKFHEEEANIIANAGMPLSVTIATNMAGRGTDIVLGGNLNSNFNINENKFKLNNDKEKYDWALRNDIVIKAGGLYVIGTERHESRRIDNQLRGRSGRQGDPGCSRFYLSIEDNLMKIFISKRIINLLNRIGVKSGHVIEHPIINKSIENAQKKVEGHNFDIRKQLLEYDNIINEQRKVIYEQRSELVDSYNISKVVFLFFRDVIDDFFYKFSSFDVLGSNDLKNIEKILFSNYKFKISFKNISSKYGISLVVLKKEILEYFIFSYIKIEQKIGSFNVRFFEKYLLLNIFDFFWKEHLSNINHVRQSIHLRGYAQKDPKQEYKREAFILFNKMLDSIKIEFVSLFFRIDFSIKSFNKVYKKKE